MVSGLQLTLQGAFDLDKVEHEHARVHEAPRAKRRKKPGCDMLPYCRVHQEYPFQLELGADPSETSQVSKFLLQGGDRVSASCFMRRRGASGILL